MIGRTISHYNILEELGGGGMGIVYKAHDTRLDRTVALKFLSPHLTLDPSARQRFVHEAKAASALDHQNICAVHDIGTTEDGQIFIVMNHYEGETLREKIETIEDGRLRIEECITIAMQVCGGLARAHEAGIVHRDIKPANIMLTIRGEAKILDFGLAKLTGQSLLTRTGSVVGTAAYMSPEQAQGLEVDHRTDIWSLGVVLYEMLTGKTPFRGDHEAAMLYSIVNENPAAIQSVRPDVPRELAQIVERAMMKKPAVRYASANEMLRDLQTFRQTLHFSADGASTLRLLFRGLGRPAVGVPIILAFFALIVLGAWYFRHESDVRRARTKLIPQIQSLVEEGIPSYPEAYRLAEEAERYLPEDSTLRALFSRISARISVTSIPAGAGVWIARYGAPDSALEFAGITPIDSLRVPADFMTMKLEKDGFEPLRAALFTFEPMANRPGFHAAAKLARRLDSAGTLPAGMVRIPGADPYPEVGALGDFFIDRFEVTNREFKKFVDAGGYEKREYWTEPFHRDGTVIPLETAMKEFVDRTRRPGPSTWEAGGYPDGEDDLPVSGVSWYEAAAYARYAGKALPTTHHWNIARGGLTSMIRSKFVATYLAPMSNFGGKGPATVGTHPAISPYGCYDMSGNVREWCWNTTRGGRMLRGGAWNDIPYMFGNPSQASAFDRSPKNGFRCAIYVEPDKIPRKAFEEVNLAFEPDFYKMPPVSDAVFRVYRNQFSYDPSPLDARVEWRDESAPGWIQEKVSFNAAYGNERVVLYLFLPRTAPPPFQTIVYFPGSSSVYQQSSKDLAEFFEFRRNLSFLPTSGRAVAYPVYKGTFERGNEELTPIHDGDTTHRYTTYLTEIVKDYRRTLDYLETRKEIDASKFAYFGFSWGGMYSAVIPAVEDRLRASIVGVGGLWGFARPEASEATYVSRVKIPTLMLNGRYDMTFPLETSVKPMFDLLGTRAVDKRLIVYDTDHFIPRNEVIKETLAWLDKYLGTVSR